MNVVISEYDKIYYGETAEDAVSNIVEVHVTNLVGGSFSVKVKVIGYPLRDWHGYSADWTEEEVLRNVLKVIANKIISRSDFTDFKLYKQL